MGKTLISVILMGLILSGLQAQNRYRAGWIAQLSGKLPLSERWSLLGQFESRQIGASGRFDQALAWDYRYERTELACFLEQTGVAANAWAGGYLLRLQGSNFIHRLTQQYAWTSELTGLRLGHRLRTDQTFGVNRLPGYRLRYRLSGQFALQGQEVNDREWYLKTSQESLIERETDQWDLELRAAAVLGLRLRDGNKLESGLDYRIAGLWQKGTAHQFWWVLAWYISLKPRAE